MMKANCDTIKLIHSLGLKHTKDRHTMIDLFFDDRTWSAAQLANEMGATHTSTIYRNIETFLRVKLIREVHSHDGQTYYEWADQKHHDHNACNNCDVIECIPCPIPKTKNHFLEINELCSTCK